MDKHIISTSPHIRSKLTSRRIMLDVLIALLPCCIAAIVFFGWYSLAIMAISVASCVISEIAYKIIEKKAWEDWSAVMNHIFSRFDFSSVVTGIILSLILPTRVNINGELALLPWYMPLLGGMFAILLCKMLFGGTGRNLVNPACAGRVFLFISYMSIMTACVGNCVISPLVELSAAEGEILSGATPLTALLEGNKTLSPLDLFLGTGVDGAMGETCKLAILIGYLYLCVRRTIKWYYPLMAIGASAALCLFMEGFDFSITLSSVLSGGLLFGSVFMATDYVTNPKSTLGNVIFFVSFGLLNAGLRKATGIEVTSFCLLIMNCITPLIDLVVPRRPFGFVRPVKGAKA
ncbi:MAG: RnfABCDGE type electron transport complex subunit D [Clostridia bacterium]|nr:RnfABCDGE type electron transport complex subunit D [Clostridia bacterium]